MDDIFKQFREWQRIINHLNKNQELINSLSKTSELTSKMVNNNILTSYMEHASALEKINTLTSEVAKSAILADTIIKSGLIASEISKSSLFINSLYKEPSWSSMSMINIPSHDFSQIDSALAVLSNQEIAFSNTYKFAPFFKYISSEVNSTFIENLSNYIHVIEEVELTDMGELCEEDIQIEIKKPYFWDLALKINIILNVTDTEVQQGRLTEEEVSDWKKYLFPVLTILGQIFLAWSMSATPLHEMNIYKTMEAIIHYIETFDINFDNIELPNSEEK